MKYSIEEKKDGFWLQNCRGYEQGPYEEVTDAIEDLPEGAAVTFKFLSEGDEGENDYLGWLD